MEKVCDPSNLNRAYKRVKANKGAAGVDGMTVDDLFGWIAKHKESLIESLRTGTYQPSPVLGVEIPKPGKSKETRLLGIPCVVDRLVQQAILQVLEPMFDPTFSGSSYGFRPGRSAHQALLKAREYVQAGYDIVVDIDVEKFFDRVNHDKLMFRLSKRVGDKRLLKIIRRFLEAEMLRQGICIERIEGLAQGGPLSPLMSNLVLDELDKELEHRGHKFCRYADDCNIYVKSLRAGERVLQSVKDFLAKRLKLKVNETKSACASVEERQFLGYRLLKEGKVIVAEHSLSRIQDKVRWITRRNRGVSLETVVSDLNQALRGWGNYFRLTEWPSQRKSLDGWIHHKVRCYRLKQRKRPLSIAKFLMSLGVPACSAWPVAKSGKGWWRLSLSIPVHHAMDNNWFKEIGLINLRSMKAVVKA
ncbi:group II intron reverse transcriptase/maturase [Candidatus Finniella inopinata]|uniref:Group II intron reverse transcriptase/maturase n=2 Tax=Candidatus Finniella inopinata TaxID=1696036 RepID=A0A4Q7DJC8_9PROT|nr:group II intron reverse transcriptase/maturase [Candidatus Finniella inopinata]RZI45492.1 group II intron reverse transcriptase/maturase [Candidatus Finniella inopinata]RZI46963.1 group II intron reverse transcriptase/maturase [Candidatus Finniella inopinata]